MTYGLQIFNDSGRLALSTEYKHWKFIKSVQISANLTWYDSVKNDYSYSVLVAFVGAEKGRCWFSKSIITVGMGQTIPTNAGLYIHSDSNATAYIFDIPKNSDSIGDYGVAVYNSTGELIFDSNSKYMNVVGTFTRSTLPYGNPVFVAPSGETEVATYAATKLAVIPISHLIHVELSEAYEVGVGTLTEIEEWFGASWYAVSGNKLSVAMEYISAFLPGKRGFNGRTIKTGVCYCILIDVNGL